MLQSIFCVDVNPVSFFKSVKLNVTEPYVSLYADMTSFYLRSSLKPALMNCEKEILSSLTGILSVSAVT